MTIIENEHRLLLTSIFFAVFWAAGMVWWSGDYSLSRIMVLSICGAVAGVFWYFAMEW